MPDDYLTRHTDEPDADAIVDDLLTRGFVAPAELIRRQAEELARLREERDKLAAFKAWVHARLDAGGVPAEFPDGPHSREGCRIGDRMDYVFGQVALAARLAAALETGVVMKNQWGGPCWCRTVAGIYCVGQPQCKAATAALADARAAGITPGQK